MKLTPISNHQRVYGYGGRVARTTLKIVGRLRFTDEDGLKYSIPVGKPERTIWLEALPNIDNWPTLGSAPESPKRPKLAAGRPRNHEEYRARWQAAKTAEEQWKAAEEDWKRDSQNYILALHADPTYRASAWDFMAKQQQEPKCVMASGSVTFWSFRDKILSLESTDPEIFFQKDPGHFQITDKAILLMKNYVLRRERHFEKIKRDVEALENMEKLTGVPRQPIPDSVRLLVWQRDNGQCVKCGSRERLEFDHIIPFAAGGSSTERNVQLLCETCNRSKGSTL